MAVFPIRPPRSLWRRTKPEVIVAATPPAQTALHVILVIGDRPARPVAVEVHDRLVLGLGHSDDAPGVDLSVFGGSIQGVSARHAALFQRDGHLYVEDLNSASGTRLNGLPVRRGVFLRLRNNDELELGQLRLIVRAAPQRR